jgi:splicing factor 1
MVHFSKLEKYPGIGSILNPYSSIHFYLQEKYGPFPLFWQDLEKWQHYKLIQKFYLYVTDRDLGNQAVDVAELESLIVVPAPYSNSTENFGSSAQEQDSSEANKAADDDKKKKRRNRWGVGPAEDASAPAPAELAAAVNETNHEVAPEVEWSDAPSAAPPSVAVSAEEEDPSKRRKKSRWSTNTEAPAAPAAAAAPAAPFIIPHELIQQTLVLQMQLKQVSDKLVTVVQDAILRDIDPNRSPSPPPRYDSMGKRTNTREMRMRESLNNERNRIIENLIRINPLFQPPPDFVRTKPHRKVYIPYKEHPEYNFIGLIIGPRGNTQKRMEKETNTKISIRGKGSVKEGSKGRAAGKNQDEDDDLHVYVQGETEESVSSLSSLKHKTFNVDSLFFIIGYRCRQVD